MNPDDVARDRAAVVRRAAHLLERLALDEVLRAATTTTWTGPVAARFSDRIVVHRRTIDDLVADLVAVARRLEQPL